MLYFAGRASVCLFVLLIPAIARDSFHSPAEPSPTELAVPPATTGSSGSLVPTPSPSPSAPSPTPSPSAPSPTSSPSAPSPTPSPSGGELVTTNAPTTDAPTTKSPMPDVESVERLLLKVTVSFTTMLNSTQIVLVENATRSTLNASFGDFFHWSFSLTRTPDNSTVCHGEAEYDLSDLSKYDLSDSPTPCVDILSLQEPLFTNPLQQLIAAADLAISSAVFSNCSVLYTAAPTSSPTASPIPPGPGVGLVQQYNGYRQNWIQIHTVSPIDRVNWVLAQDALFGPQFRDDDSFEWTEAYGVSTTIPETACSALPARSLTGRVALIRRGDCYFMDKVYNAQQAGAVAAVVYNSDQANPWLLSMSPASLEGISQSQILIPSYFVAYADALPWRECGWAECGDDVEVRLVPPTHAPTNSPTTPSPTGGPTIPPPSVAPTTGAPTTAAPTTQPTTPAPTRSPTGSPTSVPTTAAPTYSVRDYPGGSVLNIVTTRPEGGIGDVLANEAAFGPTLTFSLVDWLSSHPLQQTSPVTACSAISNNLTGKVALISRGSCYFRDKVWQAQQAGAIAAIVYNNNNAQDLIHMAAAGSADSGILIPSYFVRRQDGLNWINSQVNGVEIKFETFVVTNRPSAAPTVYAPTASAAPTGPVLPSVSPTEMPTVQYATRMEQSIAVTGLSSAAEYVGPLKQLMEAGYAYSIGIGTLQGQLYYGCSVVSRASSRRTDDSFDPRILLTFESSVGLDQIEEAISRSSALTGSYYTSMTQSVRTEMGAAVALPTVLGVQSVELQPSAPDGSPDGSEGEVTEGDRSTAPPLVVFVGVIVLAAAVIVCMVLCAICCIRRVVKRRRRQDIQLPNAVSSSTQPAPPTYIESYIRGDRSMNSMQPAAVSLPPDYELCDANPIVSDMDVVSLTDVVPVRMSLENMVIPDQAKPGNRSAFSIHPGVEMDQSEVEMVGLSPREIDVNEHSRLGERVHDGVLEAQELLPYELAQADPPAYDSVPQ